MRARVVDTSVLYALADSSDPHHKKAQALLEEAGPAVIPNEALVETIGVLSHRLERRAAKRFVDALRDLPGIEIGHESDIDAALRLQDQHAGLSLVDAVGVTLAWQLGCGLDTFDSRQERVFRG